MLTRHAVRGAVVQGETPSWASLESAVGTRAAAGFMWMFEIRLDDGTRVDAYKNVASRRYLHLSEGALAFASVGESRYVSVDCAQAIAEAFHGRS